MKLFQLTVFASTLCLSLAFIQVNDEKRLTQHLVSQYEKIGKLGRPVAKTTDVWNVTVGLSLLHITDVDFYTQSIEVLMWNTMSWDDVYLKWNKDDFSIKSIRVRPSDITMPDIAAYNGMSAPEDLMKDPLVVVGAEGNALYIPPQKQRFICPMSRTAKTITCSLKFGSWTYDGFHIDLKLASNTIGLDSYSINPKWSIVNTTAKRNVNFYDCCPEPYIDVTFNITLKAQPSNWHQEIPNDI